MVMVERLRDPARGEHLHLNLGLHGGEGGGGQRPCRRVRLLLGQRPHSFAHGVAL